LQPLSSPLRGHHNFAASGINGLVGLVSSDVLCLGDAGHKSHDRHGKDLVAR